MPIRFFSSHETPEQMGQAAADIIAAKISDNNSINKTTILGLATGSTPLPVYDALIQYNHAGLDFSQVKSFNLDEYIGVPEDYAHESYAAFMDTNLFSKLKPSTAIKPENIHFPDLEHPENYDDQISAAGGMDIILAGIGSDGHIAFCEPPERDDPELEFFQTRTHKAKLLEQTRRDNARFFGGDIDKVPTHAVTMGIKTFSLADTCLLMATGAHKASIVQQALEGPITSKVPATALRAHNDLRVLVDKDAASMLRLDNLVPCADNDDAEHVTPFTSGLVCQ